MVTAPALDLDALEAAAKKATPGPWVICAGQLVWDVTEDDPGFTCSGCGGVAAADHLLLSEAMRDEDRAYIAAASPDVILQLVARVRELERERDVLKETVTAVSESGLEWAARAEQAIRERDEARASLNRYVEGHENLRIERTIIMGAMDKVRAERDELAAALRPFARFSEAWAARPILGIADEVYSIHIGEDGASLRRSDCDHACAVLAALASPATALREENDDEA